MKFIHVIQEPPNKIYFINHEPTIPGNCAVVILAGGSSERLGTPKQLLPYKGQTLISYIVRQVSSSDAFPVVVVIGASGELVKKEFSNEINFVDNPQWMEGIASSIRCGLQKVLQIQSSAEGVIFTVCDQPHLSTDLINNILFSRAESRSLVVASAYKETLGTPAYFQRSLFPELMELQGHEGAKKIITRHSENLSSVPFPLGNIDIDTMDDYNEIKKGFL